MTPPQEPGGRTLAGHYEELRTWALAPDSIVARPRGAALLVQQGVPAWMQAWARWAPAPSAAPLGRADAVPSVVQAVGPAVVVLLSNMALAGREETRC